MADIDHIPAREVAIAQPVAVLVAALAKLRTRLIRQPDGVAIAQSHARRIASQRAAERLYAKARGSL